MAQVKCGSTDIGFQMRTTDNLERTLRALRGGGILPQHHAYMKLQEIRGQYTLNIGFKIPRPMTFLLKLLGLSPGEIKLWHDAESGFFTEAREKPGAPPVYHHVKDDVAMAILKGELTHELELELMKPDEYLGE